jgi:hypothetical protein
MRAAGHRWCTSILVVAVALTMGCRGTRPFSSPVQVSQKSDSEYPEIEAPQQRLATTKPRMDSSAASLGTRRSEASRSLMPRSENTSSESASDNKGSGADKTEFSFADQRSAAPSGTPSGTQKGSSTAESGKQESESTMAIADKMDGPEAAELMDAFRNYPPEVQRDFRRGLAAYSQKSDKTSPPNPLDGEPAKDARGEHESPNDKASASARSPKQVAAQRSADRASAGVTTEAAEPAKQTNSDKPGAPSADRAKFVSEASARTTAESVDKDPDSIEHAVALSDQDGKSIVAQASLDSMAVTETLSGVHGSLRDHIQAELEADVEAETKDISDRVLFAALRQRLATPVEGESEADRSARLIKLRHLMVLSGDPDSAVRELKGISEAEQEYLRHQLLGLWVMIDPQGHPVASRRFTAALPQIREATKFAAAASDSLDIRSLAFCTEIESYGQIKTFPGNRFDAGQQVILYCEIENFTVKKTEAGFETKLQGSYEIYDANNNKVVTQLLPADAQVSANYLRDYFIAYQMHLPKQLTRGTYRLQLTMEDVGGKKYGQASIPLEIVK